MTIDAKTPEEYISKVPEDRRPYFQKLREVILENLPEGFEECIHYGMVGYVVPKSIYPPGYHVGKDQPLYFLNIASQKNFIAVYHAGIYSFPELLSWFKAAYPKHCSTKLDMGKSCIRFKKAEQIPFELIGELVQKVSVQDWIIQYEKSIKNG